MPGKVARVNSVEASLKLHSLVGFGVLIATFFSQSSSSENDGVYWFEDKVNKKPVGFTGI